MSRQTSVFSIDVHDDDRSYQQTAKSIIRRLHEGCDVRVQISGTRADEPSEMTSWAAQRFLSILGDQVRRGKLDAADLERIQFI